MKRVAALLLIGLTAGCVSMPKPPPGYPADQAIVAPRLDFVLPPPAALGRNVTLAQTLVMRYGSTSFALDAQVQITGDELDFVAMDGFGRRALTIKWKGGAPDYEPAPWLPQVLRPTNILADFLICYASDDVVAAAIKKSGASVVTSGGLRRVVRDKRDLITVEYGPGEGWNRTATLRNLAFGYEIAVQSAEIR